MTSTTHYEFNAEISKLMRIIIHNFYSSKEIFLRELISNASDAIDKAKYNIILNNKNEEILQNGFIEGKIKVYANNETNTLTIEDNGIGMTENDVVSCLGTIAKSGTEEFIKNVMQQNKDNNNNNVDLIGQFGIGFYSGFLVADKVQVITKHIESTDNNIILWESNSSEGYNISYLENNDDEFKHGTKIILYLNSDQLEYLEENKISDIIKKYSGYISHSIYLLKKIKVEKVKESNNENNENNEKSEDEDIENINMDELDESKLDEDKVDEVDDDKSDEDKSDEDKVDDDKVDEDKVDDDKVDDDKVDDDKVDDDKVDDDKVDDDKVEDDKVEDDKVDENKLEDDKVEDDKVDENKLEDDKVVEDEYKFEFVEISSKPIWTKDPKTVSEEDYTKLYKSLSNDYDTYQTYKHFRAEGDVEFSAIIFIPKHAPFNMFDNKKPSKNMKLYVKKVLITDNCEDLFPEYLNFITGIVDCNDLPLNASRELLQQSKIIKKINKVLVRKTIELINELRDNEPDYLKFYDNYSKNIKLAIHEDNNNKTKLLNFLMFPTNKSNDKLISLENYIENMKENQEGIYYIIGSSLDNVKTSAFIEKLTKKDYEILFMCDPLDEYIMQQLKDFNDKKFINVIKDTINIDDSTEETKEENKDHTELCAKLKEILSNSVSNVIVSKKLESHPAIVTNPMGWSANMERIVKAQALNNQMSPFMFSQKVLEINPEHSLIKKFISSDYDKTIAELLLHVGMLAGGYELPNTNNFLLSLYNSIM